MFIMAPRQIAGDDADWGTWSKRMFLFVVTLFANLTLPRLLGGA